MEKLCKAKPIDQDGKALRFAKQSRSSKMEGLCEAKPINHHEKVLRSKANPAKLKGFASQSQSIMMERLCEAKPTHHDGKLCEAKPVRDDRKALRSKADPINMMERLCEAKRGVGADKHCRAPDGFSGDLHCEFYLISKKRTSLAIDKNNRVIRVSTTTPPAALFAVQLTRRECMASALR